MRFLVIGIDRNTGAAVLLTETPIATRKGAIGALESLAASDVHDLASYDLVLVDLDAGTPVLVVSVPAAQPEAAFEAPPADLEEPGWVPEPPAEPEAPAWEPETAAAPEVLDSAPAEVETSDEAVAFAPDAFAGVGEPLLEPTPSAVDEQGLLDALRRAADSLVQQGVEVPEPAEPAEPAADAEEIADAVPPVEMAVAEPLGVTEAMAEAPAPAEPDLAPDLEPVRPVIMGEYPESAEAPAQEAVEAQPYQPSGELEIAAYTCDDCVYSNTCPKAGESSPADCGTFQWRSF